MDMIIKKRERTFRPIEDPDRLDEDGEVIQWNIIGYEEF